VELLPIDSFLIVALSVALLATVSALVREVRVRRALERLLSKLLSRWRRNLANPRAPDDGVPSDCNERLR